MRTSSSLAYLLYRGMDTRGQKGRRERERRRVARGSAESNPSFLSALQTSLLYPYLDITEARWMHQFFKNIVDSMTSFECGPLIWFISKFERKFPFLDKLSIKRKTQKVKKNPRFSKRSEPEQRFWSFKILLFWWIRCTTFFDRILESYKRGTCGITSKEFAARAHIIWIDAQPEFIYDKRAPCYNSTQP